MKKAAKSKAKEVVSTVHKDAKRKGIPTSELETFVDDEKKKPVTLRWPRNPDLDPQLVWRGKDATADKPLEVEAYPIYIQEKIHPKTIIADLEAESKARKKASESQLDFFADFNGVPDGANKMDFYSYDQNWTNRMILGDSLQVMASLAEKEDLRGKVQCIYFDPPYGIKFNSNFQWSTTTTNVKDGVDTTQEPEMVKAFRDTWRDGIHSYLSYIRDRLTVARDLLSDSGSIFVQIGDENVHRVRAVLDEVFGNCSFLSQITYTSTVGLGGERLSNASNYVLWYAKNINFVKWRPIYVGRDFGNDVKVSFRRVQFDNSYRMSLSDYEKQFGKVNRENLKEHSAVLIALSDVTSANHGQGVSEGGFSEYKFMGKKYSPGKRTFSTSEKGMDRLARADRLAENNNGTLRYVRKYSDFDAIPISNVWTDTTTGGFKSEEKIYVVQTSEMIIQRCMLMATDPGDLVLDPTCGSGTTAYVAEQWGRRWITIDTSRVALALARARLMGARYPYYILKDTREGQLKEATETGKALSTAETFGRIRQGFVYERIPHISLKSIANDKQIDDIWDEF